MTYQVKVITDSISPKTKRITTMQLTYPRYIHAEFMTHRVFSRNASSSRAVPVNKLVESSLRDMVFPIKWGKNQAGMQANDQELSFEDQVEAEKIWQSMALACAEGVRKLGEIGLHKQWANRPLEWFGTITVVVTSTEWDNFFELRNHPMAQPEIHHLAKLMKAEMDSSFPQLLYADQWHLPYILKEEKDTHNINDLLKMSTARCARVSYLTQEGVVPSKEKDLLLYDRLVGSVPLHASPCEHQACPMAKGEEFLQGNFDGWLQYRKLVELDVP